MADEEETAMDKEVHLVVQVVVRKGEPLPEEDPRPKTPPSESEGAEPEPDAGEAPQKTDAKNSDDNTLRLWDEVAIMPVRFKGYQKVGDFEYMIKDSHHGRSLFLIFENIYDMLEKDVAGGGTAVLRPWCFPQAKTPRAAGVPTGWTAAGGFPDLTKQVQYAIDLAFERIHTLLHTYNFNRVVYSCDAEDASKIGTGIFSKTLGQDVIDYISRRIHHINHDIR